MRGRNYGRGKKPENMGKVIRRLFSYFMLYKARFVLVLICILLGSITGVLGSLFIQRLIDDYIAPMLLQSSPVYTELLKALCVMGCIYLVGIISTTIYNRVMVSISQGILKRVRDDMFAHMQKLPLKYFDSRTHGDVMSHYTNDTDTLRQMISQSIPQAFSSLITIISVLVAMLYLSVWLTILMLLGVVVMFKITKVIGGRSGRYFMQQQRQLAVVNGYIEEMVNGQKVVKVFCHEDTVKKEFAQHNEELRGHADKANTYANIMMPIMGNIGHAQYVLVALVGGLLAIFSVPNLHFFGVNELSLGAIASFMTLSKSFNMPISQISQQVNSVVMALAGAERIFKLLDEEHEVDEGSVSLVNVAEESGELKESTSRTGIWAWKRVDAAGNTEYIRLRGDVRFNDVYFGYVPEKEVLHGISLFAKPGQKIALVGATGAGKTTITNLINRFYDINSGSILYDGIPIRDIKKADLRRSLGIVLQDTHLFTGTVMENIRYGRLDATDEECIDAAKLANAHDFISRLPQGYDTVLSGDGAQLSQGQRQLLAIARCAVADPPVMILDEATSSIDTRTEAIVQRGMDSLMEGRTVFVIAHRLSTIQNAKAILVMDQGEIIERGDHDELIALGGRYHKLYTGAFELE